MLYITVNVIIIKLILQDMYTGVFKWLSEEVRELLWFGFGFMTRLKTALTNPFLPETRRLILLSLMADDFTRQRETPWAAKD